MNNIISPKYQMKLVEQVNSEIWNEYVSYRQVKQYIQKWNEKHVLTGSQNFKIILKDRSIDLESTLHEMPVDILIKIAIELGISTPDFLPSIPTFKNVIKEEYKNAFSSFDSAFKQIDTNPSLAVGLANSALESIIKDILKDERISQKITGKETLYKLSSIIVKEFKFNDSEFPKEMKTISNSLITINQAIESLRSEKTLFHGKSNDDYVIEAPIYACFILNSVTTVGLFLDSYYKTNFKKNIDQLDKGNLPF